MILTEILIWAACGAFLFVLAACSTVSLYFLPVNCYAWLRPRPIETLPKIDVDVPMPPVQPPKEREADFWGPVKYPALAQIEARRIAREYVESIGKVTE